MNRGGAWLMLSATLVALGCGTETTETAALRIIPNPEPAQPAAAATAGADSSGLSPTTPGLAFLTDYPAAVEQARAENKPLLLFFGAQWCLHSKRLAGELALHSEVAPLAGRFVCVRIDVDAEPALCDEYRVRAYPTLIIAAPGGVVLQRLTGLQTAADVAHEMSAALTAVVDRLNAPDRTIQR